MVDPLSEVIRLLHPRAVFTKGISGAGAWAVRYADFGHPSFAVVVEGSCRLAVDGEATLVLEAGDFVLLPRTPSFTMSGFGDHSVPEVIDPREAATATANVRHGRQDGAPDASLLGGYFVFDGGESDLLVSLLPRQVHIRGIPRLSALVGFLIEEALLERAGRDLVLDRLVEILLVEALRDSKSTQAPAGLLRGLADARVAAAIRKVHAEPARTWTIAGLALEAGLSRSAFFDRFTRLVGIAPMEYVLGWRMALAKQLLRGGQFAISEIAERVGYGSASTFSTAFSRHVGLPPGQYSRSGVSAAV